MANSGKVVLITGGGSGFGKETARTMISQGARVVITGRNEKKLARAAKEIGGADYFSADISSEADWNRIRDCVLEKFGKIDILINNAGCGVVIKNLAQQSLQEIQTCISTNLFGPILGIRAIAPIMKKQGGGTIINVSSVCAKHAWEGYSVYAAAKAGVLSLSKSAYAELQQDHIRVTCVIPGAGATDFQINAQDTPLAENSERLEPQDLAQAICDICALPEHVVVEEITVWGKSQVVRPF